MGTKDTDELIAIWKENDHGLGSVLAFGAIQKILLERGVTLPKQGQMKVTVLPPPKLEIPWHIPYISWLGFSLPWVLFGLFLVWVFLIHPLYFFTRFDGPLWPDIFLRLAAYDLSQNIQVFGKFHLILRYIEFGIMSYGLLTGYYILRKSKKAVAMVKMYLIQFLLFSIYLLLFFNVVPLAILYWEINNSIFDLKPDWKMWMETMHSYSRMIGSRWEFLLETLKVYSIPMFSTLIWFVFLVRSKWIAKTFSKNPQSTS